MEIFFLTVLLFSHFSRGPGLWQHKLLLHPSSCRHTLTLPAHQLTPAIYWWTVLDGKGLGGCVASPRHFCAWGEKRRQEGGTGEKAEVQEHSAAQWTGPGQHRVRHNLIQDCQCLIILVGLTSFLRNIIVVLLCWSIIQQLYQEHHSDEGWRDGSFVLAAEPLLKYSWPVVYLRHPSSSSKMLSSLSRMSEGYPSLPKKAQPEIKM